MVYYSEYYDCLGILYSDSRLKHVQLLQINEDRIFIPFTAANWIKVGSL